MSTGVRASDRDAIDMQNQKTGSASAKEEAHHIARRGAIVKGEAAVEFGILPIIHVILLL